jgi:uncharacterized coiled-coil protein SlyX
MQDGAAPVESRLADLETRVAALHREIQTLADAVTRAIDLAMHVKLELEEERRQPKGAASDEAA